MCLSCWISGFIVLLYRWSLSNNSWVIETITCSLDSWLTVLVCRPNHCCLGFTVEFTAVNSMVWLVGIMGNIKRIWMRWRSTQPTTLTLRCLCKHDWSGTKLTETLYEDNISPSNLLKTDWRPPQRVLMMRILTSEEMLSKLQMIPEHQNFREALVVLP